jgi:SAM-dependent methyltransferase
MAEASSRAVPGGSAASGWLPSVGTLRQRWYADRLRRDPVAAFAHRLEAVLRPNDVVLDLGAGAGELNAYAIKGHVRRIVGVDVDPRVEGNPLLDHGLQGDICALPFREASCDVAFSIYVLEHVDRPAALAAELFRVMRPGGLCLALSPNVFHYVTLASRLTPTTFHRWFNERRGRSGEDTFPTFYRLNSRRALTRWFGGAGFETVALDTIEVQPNYLSFNALAYAVGAGYERLVNATELLSALRVNLISIFRKPLA